MKKLLLGLGSVATIAAPVVAVVSCSSWDYLQAHPVAVSEFKIPDDFGKNVSMTFIRTMRALNAGTVLKYKGASITLTPADMKSLEDAANTQGGIHDGATAGPGRNTGSWFTALGRILGTTFS